MAGISLRDVPIIETARVVTKKKKLKNGDYFS
jgi:hypothetical protein